MAKRVADQLVEMLVEAGVKRVYGITGDSLNPVNDAIRNDGRLEWVHVRHEEAGAYAASMDAELNGIGCCMGSSGPGHVHLINGLYDANRAGNPVIAIASTCPSNKFGQEYFQETNPFYLFQDCSKYVYVANTPTQFPHMMQHAIQAAIEQKGVAVVGLPGDVAAAEANDIITSQKNYKTESVYLPSDVQLDTLAELLNQNKKISLYCGHGCRHAVPEVMALAEKLKAPMAYSFRGKIFFDRVDNPYATGLNGLLGHRSGYLTCNDADVLVMLGTDFPYAEFLPQKIKIVQIDEKPSRIGRRAKVDIGLAGDIKDTINALLPKLKGNDSDEFLKKMQKEYKESEDALERFVKEDSTKTDEIQPEYVAHVINELAEDDAIFTVDTGMTSVWAARFIKGKRGRYLTGSFNHGSMANAMPMAIGAAGAAPHRQVVAMCGDGGISMLLGDLATIMQYKLPIKIIVFNNRSLGMVKLEMQVAGYVDWQTDMVNPEFDKIGELMGMKGIAVHKTSEVESAIKEAFEHDGPALVNIYTNPNSLAMPPHITLQQMKGFTTSMFKKLAEGKFGDIEQSISSNIKHLTELF
ncbi:thiamine pyrophosphate-dependent enzyme [Ornithobacterium rhinotracheale]|uniref:thiamine pyrophosphate-dependent enzyme n=1 Tax=Ornithobacterium rhinotracheale TaxID=28251 RepID=UPI001FF4FDBF|nr:thiamine pyrophosphate-dependent enzyme [Ornithobacterium rhinotracheale]MCK0204421.1 thiamine pyrophosphate-binding protein [Ornithobacterium rhinotracheale]